MQQTDDMILMIPGPVYVRPEILQGMSSPPWGHRDKGNRWLSCSEIYIQTSI